VAAYFLHPSQVQLDVDSLGVEWVDAVLMTPAEEAIEVGFGVDA
jgi:hypothetical protein